MIKTIFKGFYNLLIARNIFKTNESWLFIHNNIIKLIIITIYALLARSFYLNSIIVCFTKVKRGDDCLTKASLPPIGHLWIQVSLYFTEMSGITNN